MGRRSDVKERMVVAARQLVRERGYHATALSDVLQLSLAPRGSIYFHFPGGKTELVTEAAGVHLRDQIGLIDRAADVAASGADLVRSYVDLARDNLVDSDFALGCGLAPLVVEAARESAALGETGRRAFSAIIDHFAVRLKGLGVGADDARVLAAAVVSAVEGALVTARALRSPEPFDSISAVLVDRATAVAQREAGSSDVD